MGSVVTPLNRVLHIYFDFLIVVEIQRKMKIPCNTGYLRCLQICRYFSKWPTGSLRCLQICRYFSQTDIYRWNSTALQSIWARPVASHSLRPRMLHGLCGGHPLKSRFTYLFWNHTYFIVKTQRKWKIPYMTCDPRVTYGVSKIYSYFSHSDFSVGYLRCLQICSTFTHTFIVRWLLTVSSNLLLLFTNRWFRWNGFYSFLSVVNYIISRIWNKSW
jgi:hypothetical protein